MLCSQYDTTEDILFREICTSDFHEIKKLHEELFPVKYNDSFYQDICVGKGINGGQIYTQLAVSKKSGQLIGFIISQLIAVEIAEDQNLFAVSFNGPRYVCYILTLGLYKVYQRTGLGTKLVNNCIERAKTEPTCGAVYLHVISYNDAAIRFYRKNLFENLREIPEFYIIEGKPFTALLYILYINNYQGPLLHRAYTTASAFTLQSLIFLSDFMSNLFQHSFSDALKSLNVNTPFAFAAMTQGDVTQTTSFVVDSVASVSSGGTTTTSTGTETTGRNNTNNSIGNESNSSSIGNVPLDSEV